MNKNVLDRRKNINVEGDFVKCSSCEKMMLIDKGEDICPNCGIEGSLMWVDGNEQECNEDDLKRLGHSLCTFNMKLGDGKLIRRESKIIDISKLGFFDELEYEVWETILKYMKKLSIEIKDEDIDFNTVKEVQECILTQFTNAGFEFKYE